jgi:hypothetical protein
MRRGFSSTEVIVCTGILALAMIPVLTMIGGGTRPAAYNEYHMMAQAVSAQLIDRVSEQVAIKGFSEMEKMGIGDRIDINDTRYRIPADNAGVKLTGDGNFLPPQIFLTNLEAGGALYQISIVCSWNVPGDPHKFSFTFERLVCRPEASLLADYLPRQERRVIP